MNSFIKYFILIFSLLIFFSCKKEGVIKDPPIEEPQEVFFGEIYVLLNGEPYIFQSGGRKSTIPEKFLLYFEEVNVSGIVHNRFLSLRHIERKVGTSKLHKYEIGISQDSAYASFNMRLYDGDVVGDNYNVIDDANNFVKVDSLDPITNEIWGGFEVLLARDTSRDKIDLSFPDTLFFTDGVFHTKIFE